MDYLKKKTFSMHEKKIMIWDKCGACFLSSPSSLVNSNLKLIKLVLNDKSELLKSAYLMNDVSICENFKCSNYLKIKCIKINLLTLAVLINVNR